MSKSFQRTHTLVALLSATSTTQTGFSFILDSILRLTRKVLT